jgi:hypothetical protein
MKRTFYILISLLCALRAVATDSTAVTNDTMVTFVGDSYERGLYGQRNMFVMGSYFLNYFPQFFVSFRDHSRSGANNLDFVDGQIPKYCIPEAGYTNGKTNYLMVLYASSNGGSSSNLVYTNVVSSLEFPTNSYNVNGVLTNDGTFANVLSRYKFILIGDSPSYSDGGNSTYLYSDGAKLAGQANGNWPYVNSWNNLTNMVFSYHGGYPANSNLFFDPPAYDHPGNEYQLIWAYTTLTNLGADSNAWNAVIDFKALAIRQTNHCVVSSLTGTGSSISFTLHTDRMAPGYWVPDGTTTNDMRAGFSLMPSLANMFRETLQVTNLPPGLYSVAVDGITTNLTATQLAAGYNYATDNNNPWWNQKMAVLYLMCDYADVLHTDNVNQQPGGNAMNVNYESFANAIWATNHTGVDGYIPKLAAAEAPIITNDIAIHAAVQQTNHIVTLTLVPSAGATNLSVGTLHFGQVTTKHIWFMNGTNWPDDQWTNDWNFAGVVTATNLAVPLAKWQLVPEALEMYQGHLAFALSSAAPQLFCRGVFQAR